MINVASGDRNAIWLPRCRDALMASQQGRGKALSRWQRDKWCRDGCKDCRQHKEKEKSHGRREKTKMTTKWNLINLNLVLLPDKFSAEEEGKGNCFLGTCSPPTTTFLSGWKGKGTYGFWQCSCTCGMINDSGLALHSAEWKYLLQKHTKENPAINIILLLFTSILHRCRLEFSFNSNNNHCGHFCFSWSI